MRSSSESKYARQEWERRFLLKRLPPDARIVRVRRILDHYIDGTNLRLRRQADDFQTGQPQTDDPHNTQSAAKSRMAESKVAKPRTMFKLTQKLRSEGTGALQGTITSFYLSEAEFSVLAKLPAQTLQKTRYSVPPFGIDLFEGELQGLVLAEAEFSSAEEAARLPLPPQIAGEFLREVTNDLRFTGGELVRTSRLELRRLLEEFRLKI